MPSDPRLSELMLRWEQQRAKHQQISLEELCADCPELADELRKRVQGLELISGAMPAAHCESVDSRVATLDTLEARALRRESPKQKALPDVPGYEILEELGRGGMGVVYKARQVGLKRIVALKMIRSGIHADAEQELRFRREAEAVASLQHSNIVQIYEIGEHDGCPFFSLEFVEGGSLQKWAAGNAQAPRQAAQIVEKLARALHYAHERGIIHRDLKPANILLAGIVPEAMGDCSTLENRTRISDTQTPLTSSLVPKITDFGLAKHLGEDAGLTQSGDVMGSPSYMAPEQALGKVKELGPLVDVYALGATLFELLTGRPPFKGVSVVDTLDQVRSQEPMSLSQLQPTVPRDLETICLKCLAKDPRRRYESALALADDLGRFLDGRPIAARPVSRRERAWRWCRRNPVPTALIVSLFIGSVVAVSLTVWALANAAKANEYASKEAEQRARAEKELARSLLSQVRESSITASPGWTWKALDDIVKAQKLLGEEADAVELRTLIADALSRPDLRQIKVLAQGMDTAALAFSKDGKRLAIAEKRNAVQCSVLVFDTASWQQTANFSFFTVSDSFDKLISFHAGSHEGINSLAFSPDGKWLVAGTRHGKLVRWDTTAAKPSADFFLANGDKEVGEFVAFSPDGNFLVSGSRKHTQQWDVRKKWQLARAFPGALDAAWTPDGRSLALCSSNSLQFFDAPDYVARPPVANEVNAESLAISPNGRLVAWQGGIEMCLVDSSSNRSCARWRISDDGADHGAKPHGIQFSPDGALIVSAGTDYRIRLWDVSSGRKITELFVADRVDPSLAISPDGRYLAVGADRCTLLFELRVPDVRTTLAHQASPIQAIEFADGGKNLWCAAEKRIGDTVVAGELNAWDVATGKLMRASHLCSAQGEKIRLAGHRGSLAIKDGKFVARAASLVGIQVVPSDANNAGQIITDVPGFASAIEVPRSDWKLDGSGVEVREDPSASLGKAMRIPGNIPGAGIRFRIPDKWRKTKADECMVVFSIRVERKTTQGSAFEFSLVAPKQSWRFKVDAVDVPETDYHFWLGDHFRTKADRPWLDAAINIPDKASVGAVWVDRIYVIPLRVRTRTAINRQELLNFSPVGDRLWGVVDSDHIVSWNVADLRVATHWHDFVSANMLGYARIDSLAVGRNWALAGNERGETILLDATKGEKVNGWTNSTDGGIRAVALDPTETQAAVGTQKGKLRIISLPEGNVLLELPKHQNSVEAITMSHDGRFLYTGSLDETVRIWQKKEAGYQVLLSLKFPASRVTSLRVSSDGATLVVLTDGDRAVRIWHLEELRGRFRSFGLDW